MAARQSPYISIPEIGEDSVYSSAQIEKKTLLVHALAFHANVRVALHILVVMRVALLNNSIKFNAVFLLLPTDIIAIKANFYILRFP